MLRCDECGEIFDVPKTIEEYRGEFWGMPSYERIACCPHCGSLEIDEYRDADDEEGQDE